MRALVLALLALGCGGGDRILATVAYRGREVECLQADRTLVVGRHVRCEWSCATLIGEDGAYHEDAQVSVDVLMGPGAPEFWPIEWSQGGPCP